MSIEAMGSVSQVSGSANAASPLATPTAEPPAMEVSVKPTEASGMREPGFTEKAASQVYNTVDNLGVTLPGVEDAVSTALNRAKMELQPASSDISPGTKPASPDGNEALVALSKTFDHAVFMAMVNQIISGVSDTSRTMIKQQ